MLSARLSLALALCAGVSAAQDAKPRFGEAKILPCHVDLTEEAGAPWRDTARSIVRIYSRGKRCTGVLLNNTAQDGTPYVLTANHCGSLKNATFQFNYRTPDDPEGEVETYHQISGAIELIADHQFDFQLLRLRKNPDPAWNVRYAGWDASGVVPERVSSLHHPGGHPLKVAHEQQKPVKDERFWRVRRWDVGLTERGSSGAPLFDPAQRVIGQLSGQDGKRDPNCKRPGKDLFGRLERQWTALQPYLDPLGTGELTLDAFDPGTEPLPFSVTGVEPAELPADRTTFEVVGSAFTGQASLFLDGEELDRAHWDYRTNSRIAVTLAAELALGEHSLRVHCFETKEDATATFRVVEIAPSGGAPTPAD